MENDYIFLQPESITPTKPDFRVIIDNNSSLSYTGWNNSSDQQENIKYDDIKYGDILIKQIVAVSKLESKVESLEKEINRLTPLSKDVLELRSDIKRLDERYKDDTGYRRFFTSTLINAICAFCAIASLLVTVWLSVFKHYNAPPGKELESKAEEMSEGLHM